MAMAAEGDIVSQTTPSPESALPWWTLAFTVAAAVVVSLVSRLTIGYTSGLDPDSLVEWWHYWRLKLVLPGLVGAVWSGLTFGLGLILADRLGPRAWSRPWKWALGAGVLAVVPSPLRSWGYAVALVDGSVWQTWHLTLSLAAFNLLTAGFVGFWLARALWKQGSPWWRMPEAAIDAKLICVVVGTPLWLLWNYAINPTPEWARGLLESRLYWLGIAQTLLLAIVGGLLYGLALAAGMSRAIPHEQRTDIVEIARRVRAKLKAHLAEKFT